MTIDYSTLRTASRLLIEVQLRPLQGDRFQPTGFADLGAARYTLADGTEMLLVESAQSVANRLELACWDDAEQKLIPELSSLPYIEVVRKADGKHLTNSVLESHRINSPYILEGKDRSVFELLKTETKEMETGPVNISQLARTIFKYDTNAVLHGLFLAKSELAGGRLRLPRLLTGFIEAQNVRVAESGGVKNDRVDPRGNTAQGFGSVPFHRTEFTAEHITAYFNFDLAQLRGYRLGDQASNLLIALGLFKIQRFLSGGLRLRTACDFEVVNSPVVTRPVGFDLPTEAELLTECTKRIGACRAEKLFAEPVVTTVRWDGANAKKKNNDAPDSSSETE